jgi:hypothetical protein
VTFREDDSRVRERLLGANIAWLYRFTLSILRRHPDRRMSLIMKRRGCGWGEKLLMEIINVLVCLCALALARGTARPPMQAAAMRVWKSRTSVQSKLTISGLFRLRVSFLMTPAMA